MLSSPEVVYVLDSCTFVCTAGENMFVKVHLSPVMLHYETMKGW